MNGYGIIGKKAPDFNVSTWVDAEGKKISPINLSDFPGKKVVLFGFQSWCPGCHSRGFPTLEKLIEVSKVGGDVVFLAVQTVFEGFSVNTYERMIEVQKHYNLGIPFGHDAGNASTNNISSIMYNYRTGGTPWFVILDQEHTVVFNDFHIAIRDAIELLD